MIICKFSHKKICLHAAEPKVLVAVQPQKTEATKQEINDTVPVKGQRPDKQIFIEKLVGR